MKADTSVFWQLEAVESEALKLSHAGSIPAEMDVRELLLSLSDYHKVVCETGSLDDVAEVEMTIRQWVAELRESGDLDDDIARANSLEILEDDFIERMIETLITGKGIEPEGGNNA